MSPVNLAGGSGNRNMYFKQNVQMARLNFCVDINGQRTVNFKENLKVPKRENFSLAFFAQTKPIWVCDLENKIKKIFFGRLTP
jgi:hypothetical protein